jgi:hypothetical protein
LSFVGIYGKRTIDEFFRTNLCDKRDESSQLWLRCRYGKRHYHFGEVMQTEDWSLNCFTSRYCRNYVTVVSVILSIYCLGHINYLYVYKKIQKKILIFYKLYVHVYITYEYLSTSVWISFITWMNIQSRWKNIFEDDDRSPDRKIHFAQIL